MRPLKILLFASLALASPKSWAVSVAAGSDQFGRACDVVTWDDAGNQPRSVWIVHQTPGTFISQMTYYVGSTLVTAQAPTDTFAFCTLVNHHVDYYGGAYTTDNGEAEANGTVYNPYATSVTASVTFAGAHHLVWDGNFQMYAHPWEAAPATPTAIAQGYWYITVQYAFTDGRSDFIFSNAYDSGEMPQSSMNSTNIAPYCDFNFDGTGAGDAETSKVSGIGIGTLYQFLAPGPATPGTALSDTSGWTYSKPNTIPYAWMFNDTTSDDRELGAVQNQPYAEKDAGCNFYINGSANGDFPLPPYNSVAGQQVPNLAAGTAYLMPFQMNSDGNEVGQRFTWGTPYTAFQNNHWDGLNTSNSWQVYPVNASSFSMLIDTYSSGGVPALVTDTANVYASSLTAVEGSVVTSGPKGPGNYVSTTTGAMPTWTYPVPGFDFVVRAWRYNAAADGNAVMQLNAGGPLDRPSLILNQFPSAAPCRVLLDGAAQAAGTDYESSYDASARQLYLTFLKELPAGAQTVEVDSACGSPTASPTPCSACSATPTPTLTASDTATATPTPVPPCSSSALQQGATSASPVDAWGGNWSAWGGNAPSTINPAPFTLTSPGASGADYCAYAYGNNSATAGAPSLSAFLNAGATGVDLSGYSGVSFLFKGDGNQYQFQIHSLAETTNYNDYKYVFTSTPGWNLVTVPWTALSPAGWGPAYTWSTYITQATYLTWLPLAAGAYAFSVDDVVFTCPGPTATPTASRTPSSSPSPTPSATATATPVPAGSSPTASPTQSPSFTASPTAAPTSANPFGPLLKPGQHIIFCGDSITFRGNYTRQVENYLNTVYPTYHLTYTNVGVGGWTATNFVQYTGSIPTGLQYVVSQHPDIATVCFGMNDAGYVAFSSATGISDFAAYQSAMTTIITTLQGAGIQVVLLTPGMVDLTVPYAANPTNIDPNYNTTLGLYGQWVTTTAAAYGVPAYDIHDLALTVNAAARAAHPGLPAYTDQPQDGIHPNPSGALVYAYGLLSALGVPFESRSISVNQGAGTVSGSPGASVGPLQIQGDGCSFSLVADPMPYRNNPQALKILPFLDFQATFNNIQLSASGLSGASYSIEVDGYQSRTVSAASLRSGVNLLDYWMAPAPTSPAQVHTIQLIDAASLAGPACWSSLIDDMEQSNDFPPSPNAIDWPSNLWGGLWFGGSSNGGADTSAPSPYLMSSPGESGSYAASLSGTTNLNTDLQILMTYCYTQYDNPRDGVEFWFKGTANQPFRFQAHIEYEDAQNPPIYTDYGYNFTPADANWHLYDIPYSALSQPSWASGSQVFPFDPGQITLLEWMPYYSGAFSMSVDNLSFYCIGGPATPTPTRTPCASCASPTPTASASPTSSATRTASPSPTSTSSPSASPSATGSASPTATQTDTPVPPGSTATITPTLSPTFSASPSASPSATVTVSASPTSTPSATPTATPSSSATSSLTASATLSPSLTATSTASAPPSATFSPTASPTWTRTASPSASPTSTASAPVTATGTATETSSESATPTPVPTGSGSPSPGGTATASATPAVSATPSATGGASPQATDTAALEETLTILGVEPVPNPGPQAVYVQLAGPADRCEIAVYSCAMVKVATVSETGPLGPGWVKVALPGGALPAGLYFGRVRAYGQGRVSPPVPPVRLFLL